MPWTTLNKFAVAVAASAAIPWAAVAQNPAPPARNQVAPAQVPETVLVEGDIEWKDRSAVAARTEGVLDTVELTIGMEATAGQQIAKLHDERASLAVAKADIQAKARGQLKRAEARVDLMKAELLRAETLRKGGSRLISDADYQKAQAECKDAVAQVEEVNDSIQLAEAELAMAKRMREDHIIQAPFDGEIFDVLKHPGEAVSANEPVVQMVKTDTLRFFGYVSVSDAERIKKGLIVDIFSNIAVAGQPSQRKRFRGRLVFINPEQARSRSEASVQIKADIINNLDRDLHPGQKTEMVVYLTDNPAEIPPAPEDMIKLPAKPEGVASARAAR